MYCAGFSAESVVVIISKCHQLVLYNKITLYCMCRIQTEFNIVYLYRLLKSYADHVK